LAVWLLAVFDARYARLGHAELRRKPRLRHLFAGTPLRNKVAPSRARCFEPIRHTLAPSQKEVSFGHLRSASIVLDSD
jgi:hypothetical protein